jgi:hypothetical protein
MSRLSLNIPHTIGQEEAARRLKERIAAASVEYQGQVSDFHQEWRDHTFSFGFRALSMAVSGNIAVKDEHVALALELPMAAMFFKGAIEERIRHEAGRLLASSRTEPTVS